MKKRVNKKTVLICSFMVYTVFILFATLLLREPFEGEHLQLELFWSYKVIDIQFKQMLGNVLMFIPFGLLLSLCEKRSWLVLLSGFLFSCLVEILQLALQVGLCELDDVFHNTLGTLIGLLIGKWITKKYRKICEHTDEKETLNVR